MRCLWDKRREIGSSPLSDQATYCCFPLALSKQQTQNQREPTKSSRALSPNKCLAVSAMGVRAQAMGTSSSWADS